MKESTARRLEKAERAIRAVRAQRDAGLPDFAVSDGYYAMFYVAEVLLIERGLSFRSHGAVHGAYGKEYAKTGELDPVHHRRLLDAFQLRAEADYTLEVDLPEDAVAEVLDWAVEFLPDARRHLEEA